MRVILFCTPPKCDLPPCSYIFRKPEPLGMDINNIECSRLGAMLCLDILKGEKDMKTSDFQQQIRGTMACIKRIMMSKNDVFN